MSATPSSLTVTRLSAKVDWGTWLPVVLLVLAMLLAAPYLRRGPDPSIANDQPAAGVMVGGVPRAHPPLWGVENWPLVFEVGALLVCLGCWFFAIRANRRDPRGNHPAFVLMVATTALCWFDPPANWVTYAAYDPRLLHFPVDWPWFNLAPTVEPICVLLGYCFYWMLPGFFLIRAYRRWGHSLAVDSIWRRRPLLMMFVGGAAIGAVWDHSLEMFLTRIELYTYTQTIDGLSLRTGSTWQFPVVVEVSCIAFMMGVASLMFWQDDAGRTINERMARRLRVFQQFPRLGTHVVAIGLLSLAYIGYFGVFGVVRLTHSATAVAQPWTYLDTKVYDPHCDYAANGEPGPKYRGPLATSGCE